MKVLQGAATQLCRWRNIHNPLMENGSRWILVAASRGCPHFGLNGGNYPSIVVTRGMAGHSKWQNIKSTKEKNDMLKSNQFNALCVRIRRAALTGNGGVNPKLNNELAAAIAEARKINMPNSTIDAVLKKITNAQLKPAQIELIGPGGCLLLLEVETDNINRTIHDVKTLLRRTKLGIISKDKRFKTEFTIKGIARVSGKKDGSKLDLETATENGILLGDAEDVQDSTDVEGNPILMFVSSQEDFGKMMKWLNQSDYVVQDAGPEYVARNPIELPDDVMEQASELCTQLEGMSDVVKVNVNLR